MAVSSARAPSTHCRNRRQPPTALLACRHGQSTDPDRHPHRRRRHHRPRRRHARAQETTCACTRWATSTSSTRSSACCWPSRCPTTCASCWSVIQHELFNLGGELSIPGYDAAEGRGGAAARRGAGRTTTPTLPRLKEFILPAGTRSAALAHVCRTVARRAERAVVALAAHGDGQRRAAPVPQPPERPAVRAGARAQPRQPRRPRRRRRLLEERAAGARRWPTTLTARRAAADDQGALGEPAHRVAGARAGRRSSTLRRSASPRLSIQEVAGVARIAGDEQLRGQLRRTPDGAA